MADAKATRALQQKLKDAGFYNGPIDGDEGDQTRAAKELYDAHAREVSDKSKADTARANADAAAAAAKAEEAKTNTEAIKAKTESERIAAEDKKRADDAAAESSKRLFDTAITATSYATGVVAGTVTAKTIDAKVAEGLVNKNKELGKVAKDLRPLVDKIDTLGAGKKNASLVQRTLTKIGAIVETADKIGLTSVARGPAGPVAAAGMIAIGLGSRYASTQTDNETVKTVLNASGTAEVIAGAVVGVKDLANRAAPTATVDAKALSVIEQGRALVVGAEAAIVAEAPSLAARVLKIGGKFMLPVAAGMAAIDGVKGYQQDGVRGAARAVLSSVDVTSIVPGMDGKGLVERIFDKLAGPGERDAAGIASARVAAGKESAARERKREATPIAQEAPAVSRSTPLPAAAAAEKVSHINHGWSDAARHASQVARNVNVTVPGK